jgi:transposase InsO family protein
MICDALGHSRQAYYKHLKTEATELLQEAIIVKMVEELRRQMPRLGGKKLYHLLKAPMQAHDIDIGRDKLFDILGSYNLLVRRRKRRKPLTTESGHPFFKYPNLIRELEVMRPGQLWVSDITYIPVGTGFCYLSLITDAYSPKIVGWCLWENLKRDGTVTALKAAMDAVDTKLLAGLIHHSDRGLQYCSGEYTELLSGAGVIISMTERSDPYENAIAERVNGILKSEFGLGERMNSYATALEAVEKAINAYNTLRPHASCNYLTPDQAHRQQGKLKSKWKTDEKTKVPKQPAPALEVQLG